MGNLKMAGKNLRSNRCIPNLLASSLLSRRSPIGTKTDAAREYLAPRPAERVVITVLENTRCLITPYFKKQSQFSPFLGQKQGFRQKTKPIQSQNEPNLGVCSLWLNNQE
jgi:hypothetical protein